VRNAKTCCPHDAARIAIESSAIRRRSPLADVSRACRRRCGATLRAFTAKIPAEWATIGIGEQLALRFGHQIVGLRTFPGLSGPDAIVPSTQGALWVLLRGDNHTELYKREGSVRAAALRRVRQR